MGDETIGRLRKFNDLRQMKRVKHKTLVQMIREELGENFKDRAERYKGWSAAAYFMDHHNSNFNGELMIRVRSKVRKVVKSMTVIQEDIKIYLGLKNMGK